MDNNKRSIERRDFLKLTVASFGMAGLAACQPAPIEKIMPYAEAPEGLIPGEPLYFATCMELDGYGRGLMVKSHMGRPIKVEGNPQHPASLGATDIFAQASIRTLYDPDRARGFTNRGLARREEALLSELEQALEIQGARQGSGLRILTGAVSSPTLAAQLNSLLEEYPQARWHQYDSVGRRNVYAGAESVFGEIAEPIYHFDRAEIILSLDSNFMFQEPGALRYIRDFTTRRQVLNGQTEMNRLYVIESSPTITGAVADHRLPLQSAHIEMFARDIARRLGILDIDPVQVPNQEGWVDSLVSDLQAHPGASLVLAGLNQPPSVHALAHVMNEALGNVGNTVAYIDPVLVNPIDQLQSLRELVVDLEAGQVDLLVILGGNPAYTAPADLNLPEHIPQAGLSLYLGLYADETAALTDWHIPAAHFLEQWGDTRAYDGTISILQPLIEPLYESWSSYELLAALQGQPQLTGYSLVRQHWQAQSGELGVDEAGFDRFWRLALHDGIIAGTAFPEKQVSVSMESLAGENFPAASDQEDGETLEYVFAPDPSIWDGQFANNAWLQELPKPLTKLTWDNAVLVSPTTAQRLDLSSEEFVELRLQGRAVRAPVLILPGQADGSVMLHLGYGRTQGGRALSAAGFNVNALRTGQTPWFGYGLEIIKTGEHYPLAITQAETSMQGRDLVRSGTLTQYLENPEFALIHASELPSLYPEHPYDQHAWGMSINLNSCTGCNACVVACQAENNIPVVGKEEVRNNREMHWLRIDRYLEGDPENPQTFFQPMLCMHCEKAPCEPVCPVLATAHSSEGLNEMVYARCIGTRYCSNNCPYKVRRFNYEQYAENEFIPLNLLYNPEVTVRGRGVMEKCTYCVQRINAARSRAKIEGRRIEDGEVVTACQQACPAQAIVFGDINAENSQVRRLKEEPRDYGVLEAEGTQPRTTYLAHLRNPNPGIVDDPAGNPQG